MELLSDPSIWMAFLTLAVLEIVLGIDNIIFISILSNKLPLEQRNKARQLGIGLALVSRILLLMAIGWVMSLDNPLFNVNGTDVSWKDLILIGGGIFLIAKAVNEIHHKLEGHETAEKSLKSVTFQSVIAQIILLDLVFSLDSVITAVGMVDHIEIMVAAVVVSVAFMLAFARPVSEFVEKHPTVKMLALAFLILIGVNLVAHGFHQEIPKGYTYAAMAFSTLVEMLNLKLRKPGKKVHLTDSTLPPPDAPAPSEPTG